MVGIYNTSPGGNQILLLYGCILGEVQGEVGIYNTSPWAKGTPPPISVTMGFNQKVCSIHAIFFEYNVERRVIIVQGDRSFNHKVKKQTFLLTFNKSDVYNCIQEY